MHQMNWAFFASSFSFGYINVWALMHYSRARFNTFPLYIQLTVLYIHNLYLYFFVCPLKLGLNIILIPNFVWCTKSYIAFLSLTNSELCIKRHNFCIITIRLTNTKNSIFELNLNIKYYIIPYFIIKLQFDTKINPIIIIVFYWTLVFV